MTRLDVVASGMVTPVGYQGPSTCAAIRVGLDGFRKTAFSFDGESISAAAVDAPDEITGLAKLRWMVVEAIQQCVAAAYPEATGDIALAVCVSEDARPGRPDLLDARFLTNVISGLEEGQRVGPHRRLYSSGSVGGVEALAWADQVLGEGDARFCVVAGVDSYLDAATLRSYHARRRLRTVKNLDGFIPGESAAAILLSRGSTAPVAIECVGLGWGREHAAQDSELPLRGDGLAQAYRAAFKDAGFGFPSVDYRIADIAGDQYGFREASLALLRLLRVPKETFDLWTPADCVGRMGAASVPLALGVALAAARRGYAPGAGALCHFTDESGVRAAVVLRQRGSAPAMGEEGWSRA